MQDSLSSHHGALDISSPASLARWEELKAFDHDKLAYMAMKLERAINPEVGYALPRPARETASASGS